MAEHHKPETGEEENSWGGDFNPFADPEERRVLFAAFDSFRCVERQLITTYLFWLVVSVSKQPIDIQSHNVLANISTDNIGEMRI